MAVLQAQQMLGRERTNAEDWKDVMVCRNAILTVSYQHVLKANYERKPF
jgi:hypothetical protein